MKKTIDPQYIEFLKAQRQKARTDLLFLCSILGYKDVEPEVHLPIIERLQKFPGGKDYFDGHSWYYEPATDLWRLDDGRPRKRLILYPRGHLKTTIITIAHTIQWILNYPDIRILISTATGDQVTKMVTEIKGQFQYNNIFRHLFPEYCPPPKRAADFGTQESFTTPARRKKWLKEATVATATVGKVIAGSHYEVIKNSDLVDKENVKTPGQIQDVISHFGHLNPLLERGPIPPYHGWIDVEGTRYDFSDLYGVIIDSEEKNHRGDWAVFVQGAYKDDGSSLWPTRFPKEELESIKRDPTVGLAIFAAQYLNNPVPAEGGLCDPKQLKWFPFDLLKKLLPALRVHTTIDLHGMEANTGTNDYTVITTAGFDRDGRMYVFDVRRGHFTPAQVIDTIFHVHKTYRPLDFKIEKDAHARVLLPFLEREKSKRGTFPLIVPIRRDNRTSKKNRIRGLQPWFETGNIRFLEDLPCKIDLVQEIARFPKYIHDDILDTLADQLQNSEGEANPDVYPHARGERGISIANPTPKFKGFDERGQPKWEGEGGSGHYYDPRTGI